MTTHLTAHEALERWRKSGAPEKSRRLTASLAVAREVAAVRPGKWQPIQRQSGIGAEMRDDHGCFRAAWTRLHSDSVCAGVTTVSG